MAPVAGPIGGMMTGCLATLLVAAAMVDGRWLPEIVAGMTAPLVAVSVSWLLIVRVHRRDPAAVTSQMIAMFLAKMVSFAAYVVVMVGVAGLRPVPFIISFTAYFVSLYGVEAVLLLRLSRATQARG